MNITPNARARVRRLGYVCPSCRLAQRRSISTSFLQRMDEARTIWAAQAQEIKRGKQPSPLKVLEDRGFVHQITGERKDLDKLMTDKRIGVYLGIDPTAPSLHVGHMLPLMALFWMHVMGFHTVSVIGAGTARIGDPTGRSKDRPEMTSTERKANIVGLHYQLKKMWSNLEVTSQRHGFTWTKHWHRELVNNAVWWNKVAFVDVLKYLGKGLRLGELLKRDTVKKKMESGDGMSFAEFCYPLMQAWDWWYMYDTKNIQMQIGGSDQYGNIVAGVEAVKYMAKTHPNPDVRQEGGVSAETMPYGLTVPLLTNAAGEKFGKSNGNAVWLDENMTEQFQLYAFFVRTADTEVERYLKMFTFLPLDSIAKIMEDHQQDTSKQKAQKSLAYEFCHLVHGPEKTEKAKVKYENLAAARNSTTLESLLSVTPEEELASHFAREIDPPPLTGENKLSSHVLEREQRRGTWASPKLNPYAPPADPNKTSGSTKHVILPKSLVKDQSIAKVLYSAGLVTSRSEGHRLAQAKGAYLGRQSSNKAQMTDEMQFVPAKLTDPGLTWSFVIRDHESGGMDKPGEEGLLILRTGKWKTRIVRIVTDERFQELGLPDPPGWQEFKSIAAATRAQFELDKGGIKPAGHTQGPPPPEDRPAPPDEPFVEPTQYYSRREKQAARNEQVQRGWAYFDRLQNRPLSRSLKRDFDSLPADPPLPPGTPAQPSLEQLDVLRSPTSSTADGGIKYKINPSREPTRPKQMIFPWENKPQLTQHRKRVLLKAAERASLARSETNLAEGRFADEPPASSDEYGYDGYAAAAYRHEYVSREPPRQSTAPADRDREARAADKASAAAARAETAGDAGGADGDEDGGAADEQAERKARRRALEAERARLLQGWARSKTRAGGLGPVKGAAG